MLTRYARAMQRRIARLFGTLKDGEAVAEPGSTAIAGKGGQGRRGGKGGNATARNGAAAVGGKGGDAE